MKPTLHNDILYILLWDSQSRHQVLLCWSTLAPIGSSFVQFRLQLPELLNMKYWFHQVCKLWKNFNDFDHFLGCEPDVAEDEEVHEDQDLTPRGQELNVNEAVGYRPWSEAESVKFLFCHICGMF